jgi:hypothetical protein
MEFAYRMWYVLWLPSSDTAGTAIVKMPLLPLEPGPKECAQYKDVPEPSYPAEGQSWLVFHPCIINTVIKWRSKFCLSIEKHNFV